MRNNEGALDAGGATMFVCRAYQSMGVLVMLMIVVQCMQLPKSYLHQCQTQKAQHFEVPHNASSSVHIIVHVALTRCMACHSHSKPMALVCG